MTEQREYTVPLGWMDRAFSVGTKVVWFVVAVMLLIGFGHWLAGSIGLPAWVVDWVGHFPAFVYVLWRLNGGKVKVRGDELVIKWSGSEEK